MEPGLHALMLHLDRAQGHDPALDSAIAGAFADRLADDGHRAYTASVDDCCWLIRQLLPGWSWHIGYDARGLFPYAVVTDGITRSEATAPTVPLALLRAGLGAFGSGSNYLI